GGVAFSRMVLTPGRCQSSELKFVSEIRKPSSAIAVQEAVSVVRTALGLGEEGGRISRGLPPAAPAIALSVIETWRSRCQPGSEARLVWLKVWLPSSKSSR